MTDEINSPAHYKAGDIEVIDIIEEFELGFHLGNAIKYILRAGRKSTNIERDLKKSIWYLNRYLRIMQLRVTPEVKKQISDIIQYAENRYGEGDQ